jgi:protein arginine N-methyltransferase 1
MYSVADYGAMVGDRDRLEAFARALERTVKKGSVVADIGAGSGIFSVLACKLGARRVFALEPGDIFWILKEVIAENGYADRVECIQALSTEVTLPERADVVIADLRGALPIYENNLGAIVDARERHLAPGGTLIGTRDTIRVVTISAGGMYERLFGPWIEPARATFDSARKYALNAFHRARQEELEMLSTIETWCELDYRTLTDTRVAGTARMPVTRPGTAHGLLMWFDCETLPGIGFSNAPGLNLKSVYNQRFLGFPEPVEVRPGDVFDVEFHADPVGGDYTWRWTTTLRDAAGGVRKEFRQSTFFSSPIAAETLALRAAGHRPDLNEEGAIERFILERMDGKKSLEDIARELRNAFPQRFRETKTAFDRVCDVSVRFGRRPAR